MTDSRQCGAYFEDSAICYLQKQGLTLVAKNYFSKYGEIDLIMQDGSCTVFIEVRYRKNTRYGDAVSTVGYHKQQRIINTAYDWMFGQQFNAEQLEYRFDIFAINGKQYQWIQNAFQNI